MVANPYQTGPWSSKSYAFVGTYHGRVESIKDPDRRNRVQVRIFGYQDDPSSIPKDLLEWIHVRVTTDSQMPGNESTQPFYPGADVMVDDYGTERYVTGAIPGYDKEKWLNQNTGGLGISDQYPDVNATQRTAKYGGKEMGVNVRSSPGINKGQADKYLQLQNYANMLHNWVKVSFGEEAPAPYGQGTQAFQRDLKSIGVDKLVTKSDILQIIKKLDNNQSGAVIPGVDIIMRLRNGGFGTGLEAIGASLINNENAIFDGIFGVLLAISKKNKVNDTAEQAKKNKKLSKGKKNHKENMEVLNDSMAMLSDPTLGIDFNLLAMIQTLIDNLNLGYDNMTESQYDAAIDNIQAQIAPLFQVAATKLFDDINTIASMADTETDIINTFGGVDECVNLANSCIELAMAVNLPSSTVDSLANGLMGLARKGLLKNTAQNNKKSNQNQGDTSVSISLKGTSGAAQLMTNFFIGNPIALQEIASGQLIKTFLSGNPIKYESNDRNDGKDIALKRFPDKKEAGSQSPANTQPKPVGSYYETGDITQSNTRIV